MLRTADLKLHYITLHFGPFGIALARTHHERSANCPWTVRSAYICQVETGRKLDTPWTVSRLLVRCEPGVMCICRCCRDGVVTVTVNVHYQAHFRKITSNAPSPSVHLGVQCYLQPARYSSPITTQSSPAVTRCILNAPQFTYPRKDGRLSEPEWPGDRTRALLRSERSRRPLNQLS